MRVQNISELVRNVLQIRMVFDLNTQKIIKKLFLFVGYLFSLIKVSYRYINQLFQSFDAKCSITVHQNNLATYV